MLLRSKEFIRFVIAGVANTALTYAVYFVLLWIIPYLYAYTCAYLLGLVISYWLNSMFVFQTPLGDADPRRFLLIYLAQYACSSLLLWFVVSQIGLTAELGLIVVIVVMVPATYFGLRLLFVGKAGGNVSARHEVPLRTGSQKRDRDSAGK